MLQWLRTLLRGKKTVAPHRAWVERSASSNAPAPRATAQGSSIHVVASPVAAPDTAEPEAAVEAVEAQGSGEQPAAVVSDVSVSPPPAVEAPPDPRVDQAVAALTAYYESNPPRLGAFPGTAARILQVFREDDPDFNKVVHELQQDAAVVTKLLNVANSAFFGGTDSVSDIRGAVLRIGMHDVAQIALGVAGQSLFEPSSRSAFSLLPSRWNELFHTSMSAAFATAWLSQVTRMGRSDHAFLTGLLHDIGMPIALRGLAQLVLDNALDRRVLDVSEAILDRVHIELGRNVTTLSGLPDYLCAAAALHHDAEVPAGPEHAELHLVRIIDGVAAQRRGPLSPAQQTVLDRSAAALELDPRWIRVAVKEYETLAAQVTRMFGIADPFARPLAVVRAER
jgi:HD-like signal output (HDOD) protein